MIPYDFGYWGIGFIFKRSDVFSRAGTIGLMSGTTALILRLAIMYTWTSWNASEFQGLTSLWGGWTFVLAFLLVFRTQIAYGRYMEGIGLLQQTFGVWLNATSNLLAFSSEDETRTPEQEAEAIRFRHLLVRLMSLLHWTALQDIAIMEDENFSVIDITDLGRDSLKYLNESQDKMEIVMQWVQHLICTNQRNGIIWIPPPILSRVFQELSNGIVFVHDAMKITEYPFPYPYAQITTILLIAYSCTLPIVFAVTLISPAAAASLAFAIIFSQWSMNYIAAEIEMPFGDDPNDLEVRNIAETFNRKLKSLMDPRSSKVPHFQYDPSRHDVLAVSLMYSCSSDGDVHEVDENPVDRNQLAKSLSKCPKQRYIKNRRGSISDGVPNNRDSARSELEISCVRSNAQHPTSRVPPLQEKALEGGPWRSVSPVSEESQTGDKGESKALPHRTRKSESPVSPVSPSIPNARSVDVPLSGCRANNENGVPHAQPASIDISMPPLSSETKKLGNGDEPSPWSPCSWRIDS